MTIHFGRNVVGVAEEYAISISIYFIFSRSKSQANTPLDIECAT
jgi:hypothetical protein